MILILSYSSVSFSQVISDNLYAYGFDNVLNWNVVYMNSPEKLEKNVRLMFYKNIKSINQKFIACSVDKLEEDFKTMLEVDKTENDVIEFFNNPYSDSECIIYRKNNILYTKIEHFGYLITLVFLGSEESEIPLYLQMAKSYINLKISF